MSTAKRAIIDILVFSLVLACLQRAYGRQEDTPPVLINEIDIDPNKATLLGIPRKKYKPSYGVFSVAWSMDGKRLAVGIAVFRTPSHSLEGVVQILDMANPEMPRLLYTLTDPQGWVNDIAFSYDGRRLAVGSIENPYSSGHKLLVYSALMPRSPVQALIKEKEDIFTLAYNPVNGQLAAGVDNKVRVYDDASLLRYNLTDATNEIYSVAYNHNGSRLAVAGIDQKVWIYDGVNPASPLFTLTNATGEIWSAAYNHDGSRLAAGEENGVIRIYDGDNPSSPLYILHGQGGGVEEIAFSHDGSQMAVAHRSGTVNIYDGTNPSLPLFTLADGRSTKSSVAYNHDSSLLAVGGFDHKVRIYQMSTGAVRQTRAPATIVKSTAEEHIKEKYIEENYIKIAKKEAHNHQTMRLANPLIALVVVILSVTMS